MRTVTRLSFAVAMVTVLGTPASVFAQATPGSQQQAAGAPQVRRLTIDEAVQLALENNLGIRAARLDPQIEDMNILGARANWKPVFSTSLQSSNTNAPNQNFLAGAQGGKTTNDQFTSNVAFDQALHWGASYSVGWDSSRLNTNNPFSTFSPQLRSSVSVGYTQPLLRGWDIDGIRQQLQLTMKNREIADVTLRQTLATTMRTVRNAYWDLAYAIASLGVQQQSLDLAQESLRNTRARVEIGTTPPIDVVEAEAEVARRQEAVIVAQGQIATAEDILRTLVFDPNLPDFWTIRIEPSELPPFQPMTVDTEGAVRNALERRTDLLQARKSLESNEINIRYYRNQSLPELTASVNYGVQALGGTQLQRGVGPFGPGTGEVIGEAQRGYATVISDLFTNQYPSWTASVNVSYPIGTSPAQANLARVRLQQNQSQAQLRNQELLVTTQVRQAAREVQTNAQRVESSRSARQLAARRLEAEQRKFEAGTSTSFLVFQAQRDLAEAQNNELQNVLGYNRSIVDLETVQDSPLR
jgi:outer membrane protein TolC